MRFPARPIAGSRVALALGLLAILLSIPACGGGGDEAGVDADAAVEDSAESEPAADEQAEAGDKPPVDDSIEEPSVKPLARRNIEIYFPSVKEVGLIGEFREIFDTVTPGDRAKQIIADLISGPASDQGLRALPPSVRLRQVFVMENGVAYLDFTSELTEGVGGGSMTELLTVYSIVDSVVLNIPEIRRVGILVNGRPLETLNGHMDLRRPLPPDFSLILGSVIVQSDAADRPQVASAGRRPVPGS